MSVAAIAPNSNAIFRLGPAPGCVRPSLRVTILHVTDPLALTIKVSCDHEAGLGGGSDIRKYCEKGVTHDCNNFPAGVFDRLNAASEYIAGKVCE